MQTISELSDDLAVIQKLDDEPNDVGGLSAEELKALFDKAPLAIQKYINEILLPSHNALIKALADHVEVDPSSVRDNNVSVTEEVTALLELEGLNPTVKDALVRLHDNLLAQEDGLEALIGERAQLVTGSYVGTGVYGSSNPNVLTFERTPKLFLLFAGALADLFILAYPPMTYYVDPSASGSSSAIHLAWGDNSVSWYSSENAGPQQNTLDKTYYYLALCL